MLSLNIPLQKPQRSVQGPAAVSNWWLAASSWQCVHSCMTSHAQCFAKHQITQVTQHPHSPDLAPCDFWLSQTKITSEREGISDCNKIQGNTTGQLMATRRTVRGPKVPTLKGSEVSLSYVQYFLYLVSSSINVSLFHITWLDTFWTDLVFPVLYIISLWLIL